MKVKFDDCKVDDALVTYGVLQALAMHAARPDTKEPQQTIYVEICRVGEG